MRPTSTSRGPCPAPCTCPGATSSSRWRAGCPTSRARSSSTAPAACARPSRPRPGRARLHRRAVGGRAASTAGRTRARLGRPRRPSTPDQRNRYQRHLLLPEVGEAGQLKLLGSKVLLLGAGGLGLAGRPLPGGRRRRHARDHRHGRGRRLQPAAPDPPQHGPGGRPQGGLGQEDADRAATPTSNVVTYDVRLGADNILDIIDGYDVIVDGTDNFPTRYLVNDASLLKRIPSSTGRSSASRARPPSSTPTRGPATAASSPSRRRRSWPRRAPRPACSACCPGSSAPSRPSRRSSSCSVSGTPSSGRLLAYDALEQSSGPSRSAGTRSARPAGPNAGEIVIAEYDELCMPHPKQAAGQAGPSVPRARELIAN